MITCDGTNSPNLTVSDDKSNTHNVSTKLIHTGSNQYYWIFWLGNITNAPITIIGTFSATCVYRRIQISEWSGGLASSNPSDGILLQYNSTSATTQTSGLLTTTTNGDLLYGIGGNASGTPPNTLTAGSGYTPINVAATTDICENIDEYQVQSTAGAVSSSFHQSLTQPAVVAILALKPAAGGGVAETNSFFRPGVNLARFTPTALARPIQSWDVEPRVQETNTHFLSGFTPYRFTRPIPSADLSSPPVKETNVHFVSRFTPYSFTRPIPSADPSSPPVQETNTHFIPRFTPYKFSRPIVSMDQGLILTGQVLFDASTGSGKTTDSIGAVTTISNTNLTVGSGSNRAMVAFISINTSTVPSGLTLTWDAGGSNQAMTLISGSAIQGTNELVYQAIFGLLNPVSGKKTLTATWSSPSGEAHLAAASFTGVNQTSIAAAFPHATSGEVNATSGTITITSAVGDMVAACFAQGSFSYTSTSGTTIDLDTTSTGILSMSSLYDNGAASVTETSAWNASTVWYVRSGVDIAFSGAAPVVETNGSVLSSFRPYSFTRPIQSWDVEPRVQETNTHFLAPFRPYQFSRPIISWDEARPPAVETNTHFLSRFSPPVFTRPILSADLASPPVVETNTHFIPRFTPYRFTQPIQSADLASPPVAETNPHFIASFTPTRFTRPILFQDFGPPVQETNPHFLSRFTSVQFTRPIQSWDIQPPVVLVQPETNVSFISSFKPYVFTRPIISWDEARPPVQETNVHFISPFSNYKFSRPIQSFDEAQPSVIETNTALETNGRFLLRFTAPVFSRPIQSYNSDVYVAPVGPPPLHDMPFHIGVMGRMMGS